VWCVAEEVFQKHSPEDTTSADVLHAQEFQLQFFRTHDESTQFADTYDFCITELQRPVTSGHHKNRIVLGFLMNKFINKSVGGSYCLNENCAIPRNIVVLHFLRSHLCTDTSQLVRVVVASLSPHVRRVRPICDRDCLSHIIIFSNQPLA
jgi:hypothetical protein